MVVLATVFGAICVSGRMGMLFYYIVYVVGGDNPFALISPTFTTMTVAALIGVLSMVPLFWYKLDDKRVSEIRADLEAGKHAWDK